MNLGKVIGLNDILTEVWKYIKERRIQWLTKLFSIIFEARKMPNSQRHSITVPIYKQINMLFENCTNYKEIKQRVT